MASLVATTAVAAACLYWALRAHWAARGLVHPLYKVRTCAACKLPRDACACRACCQTPKAHTPASGAVDRANEKPRPPGRVRLLKAQTARVKRELAKVGVNVTAAAARGLLGFDQPPQRAADGLWECLAAKLAPGMAEDNYGAWHVDHVTPVALFDLRQPDHRRRAFHCANMAPMWAADNLAKGCRVAP
jgi:hypothetical protein